MYGFNLINLANMYTALIYGSTFVLIGGVGLCISSFIIGKTLYNNDNFFYEESIDVELIPIFDEFKDVDKYNKNYIEELDLLKHEDLSTQFIDTLTNKIVFDETPMGKIIMLYDKHIEGFKWYCNTSHVTYDTLATLARKYVVNYNCKALYISLKDELNKNKEILNKTMEEAKQTKSNEKIKLLSKKEVVDKLMIKNNIILFKYSGKIYEYENNNDNKNKSNGKKITFNDFKKLKLS